MSDFDFTTLPVGTVLFVAQQGCKRECGEYRILALDKYSSETLIIARSLSFGGGLEEFRPSGQSRRSCLRLLPPKRKFLARLLVRTTSLGKETETIFMTKCSADFGRSRTDFEGPGIKVIADKYIELNEGEGLEDG